MAGSGRTFWYLERAPAMAAAASIVLGLLALIGLAFEVELPQSVFLGLVAVKANAALGFVLAGTSLYTSSAVTTPNRIASQAIAAIVLLLGLSTLIEYLSGVDLGIDQLLIRDVTRLPGDIPGRMALSTSLCFFSLGASLLLLARNQRAAIAQALAILPILVAGAALIAYGYDLEAFLRSRLNYRPMALYTAAVFVVLGLGVLNARDDFPFKRILMSESAAGASARRMLPVAIAFPFVAGYLVLKGLELGDFSHALGLALLAAANIAAFSALVLRNSGKLYVADMKRQHDEDLLQKNAEEIEDLYNHAPVGYHSIDQKCRFLRINDTELSWLGYTRAEIVGRMSFIDLLTEESRPVFIGNYPEFLAHGRMRDLELEMLRKDGSVLPVLLSATAVKSKNGDYSMSRSTVYDITELKKTQAALRETELHTRQLLEQLPTAVVVHGPDSVISYANETALRLLGLTTEQTLGKSALDPDWHFLRGDGSVMPPGEYPVIRVLAEKVPLRDQLLGIVHSSGAQPLWVYMNAFPSIGSDGSLREVVVAFVDITERQHAEEQLRALQAKLREESIRDSLTGLYNRRYLEEGLAHELARAARETYPVAILMGDIDHFKQLNDSHGHQAGDEMLRNIGSLLQNRARASDIPCRYGGEEFLVVLPNSSLEMARERAERVRNDFSELQIEFAGTTLRATVSIGVSVYPEHGEHAEQLISAADQALYRAKQQGRNRVCAAQ